MVLPWIQAHPAELGFAASVFAGNVIAAAVFLNHRIAFWALLEIWKKSVDVEHRFYELYLSVGSNPKGCPRVAIRYLDPLAKEGALDGIVPVFPATKAKDPAAAAGYRKRLDALDSNGTAAVGTRAPFQQPVALCEVET